MKKMRLYFMVSLFLFIVAVIGVARNFRVNQIPNGSENTCANCHINPAGGGARNVFGIEVGTNFLSSGNVVWNINLASLDSDGDKVPNGVELQDLFGTWMTGQPNPGDNTKVTLPGDATSFKDGTVSVVFAGMTPHVGQKLELRLVNQSNLVEISRSVVNAIPAAAFIAVLTDLTPGSSYNVDFYADHNNNGQYDAPPTDHAWRVALNNVTDSTAMVNFTHNTNFTDINWPTAIIANPGSGIPGEFSLAQNYPNPFNPITHISFALPKNSRVKVEVFNLNGQRIRSLADNEISAGNYTVTWDGLDQYGHQVSSGVYLYRLSTPDVIQSKRMLLVK